MTDESEVTPIDRPLMRSDLDDVRKAVHHLQGLAIKSYNEAKAARAEPRFLAAVCVICAVVSVSCALAGIH